MENGSIKVNLQKASLPFSRARDHVAAYTMLLISLVNEEKNLTPEHALMLQLVSGKVIDKDFRVKVKNWVIGKGLVELDSGLSLSLENYYLFFCLYSGTPNINPAEYKAFRRKNTPQKLDFISSNFGVRSEEYAYILELTKLRNCVTHNEGLVEHLDHMSDSDKLEISWIDTDYNILDAEGKFVRKVDKLKEVSNLENGQTVKAVDAFKKKVFLKGENISLKEAEFFGIILQYSRVMDIVNQGLSKVIPAKQIEIKEAGNFHPKLKNFLVVSYPGDRGNQDIG